MSSRVVNVSPAAESGHATPSANEQKTQEHAITFHVENDAADEANGKVAPSSAVEMQSTVDNSSKLSHSNSNSSALGPMLTFRDCNISSIDPPCHILSNVQGYVRRGGMTALMGASGSGKTVLMRALAGREPLLNVSGVFALNGAIMNPNHPNNIGFVPQEDILIGELTVRETLRVSARLRLDVDEETLEHHISRVIKGLGLEHVADNVVGTVLKRGLSGGEKRRCSVGVELVARPTVIFIDEPTSGLDASSAYIVLKSIQTMARESQGSIAVMASIHQPNSRLLSLFDDLLLLGRKSMVFFGSVEHSLVHFANLGFQCPKLTTPTDYYIHIIDQRFKTNHKKKKNFIIVKPRSDSNTQNLELKEEEMERANHFDFVTAYQLSTYSQDTRTLIDAEENRNLDAYTHEDEKPTYATSWLTQLNVLIRRNLLVSVRDITLYILQFVLTTGYGFMVGAEFFNLPADIGGRMQDYTNGIVWLVFVATYINVFKVYFLMNSKVRFHHEHKNQSYSASAYAVADFLVTCFCTFLTFIPGLVLAYFMMGMPASAVGYVIFSLFVVGMTAESLMDFLCQFFDYIPTSILVSQGTLVIWCVFAGGAFIRWQNIGWWKWLSECSLYTWSTRGMMIHVFKHITYSCDSNYMINGGTQCSYNGLTYNCNPNISTPQICYIEGSEVLKTYKGVSETDEWYELGILILIGFCFRIATYVLFRLPWHILHARVVRYFKPTSLTATMLDQETQITRLAARVHLLENVNHIEQNDELTTNIDEIEQKNDETAPMLSDLARLRSFRNSRIPLTWKNLTLKLRTKDTVLVDDIDGIASPGRVLAIMGPSGAGKTTMLNALSGRAPYARISGDVRLGKDALGKDHLDYVPQFDSLNPKFTVKQAFCIMAKLKNKEAECRRRVSELLVILGLTTKSDHMIETLSSGDRKRVSIGMGLISNPSILFLDEPTTGLDSEAALVVVEYLIKVARSTGVICVMTIHQPSSEIFQQLDDLLLLSKGRVAYFGSAQAATPYFASQGFAVPASTNPSDYFLDLANAKSMADLQPDNSQAANQPIPDWKKLYTSSPYCYKADKENSFNDLSVQPPDRPSELTRLSVLTRSKMLYFWQERAIYIYRLVQLILVGLFIGTLFLRQTRSFSSLNEIAGALFFNVWVILFAAIGATPIFVRDLFSFENEYLNGGFELWTHCVSLVLSSFPYHLVTAIVYQCIVWFMVGFNDSFEPWLFSMFSTFALLLLMEGVSLIIVTVLKDAMLSTTFTMIVMGTFFLFPGFFIKVPDMVRSIFWLSYLVPTKYSLDSQLINIFHGQEYETGYGNMTKPGDWVTTNVFALTDQREKWADWVIVMSYAAAFRIIHYLLLKFQYRSFAKGKLAEN